MYTKYSAPRHTTEKVYITKWKLLTVITSLRLWFWISYSCSYMKSLRVLLHCSLSTLILTTFFFSCCIHSHRLFNFFMFSHSYSWSIWRWWRQRRCYLLCFALFLLSDLDKNQNNMHTSLYSRTWRERQTFKTHKHTYRIKRRSVKLTSPNTH